MTGDERGPPMLRVSALSQLGEALRYVAHMDSLLALAVLSLLLGALERASGFPLPGAWLALPLARLCWLAYFFLVFFKATAGKQRLPRFGNYIATWDALILPLLAACLISIWLVLPGALAVHFSVGWRDFIERLQISPLRFSREPYLAAYLALGWVCFVWPPGLVATALERRRWALLDPFCGLRMVLPLGFRYAEGLGALHTLTLLGLLFDSLAVTLQQRLPIPFVAPVLGNLLVLWVPLAQARLWGAFVHRERKTMEPSRAAS
ncbi:MAG: hypothetical protein JRH20_01840 [Deltaproteobacteria bacterium]|nr:hypothetical protein [Deltaproteobacteria bacterium]